MDLPWSLLQCSRDHPETKNPIIPRHSTCPSDEARLTEVDEYVNVVDDDDDACADL